MLSDIGVVVTALSGFLISCYIAYQKIKNQLVFCPVGKDCNEVLSSRYNRSFGLPNEILGIAYYGITAASYGIVFLVNGTIPRELHFAFLVVSLSALLFSIYLVYVMAVVLKKWCEWCVASAVFSLTIFVLMLVG